MNESHQVSTSCVVYYAPRDVRIETMDDLPKLESGDVLVQVEACAICGTDVKSYSKGNPRLKPPQIMGHEFCGTIQEIHPPVHQYRVGQRVTMATTIGCGECGYCRMGKTNLCRSAEAMSFHYPGAMAPCVRIPAKAVRQNHLVEVGDLDASLASLGEPLSCVINSLGRVPPAELNSLLIIGMGPLGFLHAVAAQSMGIQTICCVARPGKRHDLARTIGLGTVLTPEQLDQEYQDHTQGEGFDLVVVTAPDNQIQAKSPEYARKGGYVSLFASLPVGNEMLSINSRTVHYNELMVYGTSDSTPAHVQAAVHLLQTSGELIAPIITHRFPFEHFHQAMQEIEARNAVKVVLEPA